MLRRSLPSDKITLPFVKAGSPLHRAIVASEVAALSEEVWSTPYLCWHGHQDWNSYYRSLKPDFRAELSRTRRRLSEQGNLTFELVTDSTRVPAVLDWLFRHKTDLLARTNQQSIWRETDVYRNFLIAVTRTEMFEQIRLFNLRLNDQIVSAVLCRISKYRVELVIAAFDPTFSKYGPGHLLFEGVLKWAFERRLDCDFRLGREAYKKLWTNSTSEAITYRFVNSLRGAAFVSAKRFLRLGATAILGRKVLKDA